MLIVERSEKEALAHAFVNFILQPEVHARLAREMFFATPSESAIAILAETAPDQLSNPAIYPPNSQITKGYPIVLDNPLVARFAKHLFGD